MSQENVELIHGFYEAYNRGDMHRVHEVFDPEVVWNLSTFTAGGWPGQEVYLGPDGVTAFLTEWRSIFGQTPLCRSRRSSTRGSGRWSWRPSAVGHHRILSSSTRASRRSTRFETVGSNGSTTTGTDR